MLGTALLVGREAEVRLGLLHMAMPKVNGLGV